ncbi:MAG TPA: MFS transporter [Anaerolineales bacterium]
MTESELDLETPASYLDVVRRNHNYRSIWIGEIVSLFGDWFNLIASAALVATLTHSGLAVGGLFVIRMLAPFLISPLAGVAADRYNRKLLLIAADLSRALVVSGFLLVRNANQVWLLYTLTAVQLALSGFFIPARGAILPDIVSRRELGAANALSSITWSVMLALGAALGGLVAGEWGIYPAFVVDALSFVWSAVFISRIHYIPLPAAHAAGNIWQVALSQYAEGLSYLRHHADILAIALHKSATSLTVNGAFQVAMVALAEKTFPIGQGGGTSLGLMYAVWGLGTGLGPVLTRRITGDRERLQRLALVFSYGFCVLGLAIAAPVSSFALVLLGTFLRSIGSGINWVFSSQLLLQNLPGWVRGRVFSTEFAMFTLSSAISTAAAGWALDNSTLGVSGLLWLLAGLTVMPGVLWSIWVARGKRGE